MNESSGRYQLRSRGQESGPYSVEAIEQMLEAQEIGIWHEIYDQGRWVSLEDFLAGLDRRRQAEEPRQREARRVGQANPKSPPESRTDGEDLPDRAGQGGDHSEPTVRGMPAYPHKRRVIYAGLALIAGYAGLHNFYAGLYVRAVIQVLLSATTVFFGFGWFVTWVWAIIEAIVVRTDSRGGRMR